MNTCTVKRNNKNQKSNVFIKQNNMKQSNMNESNLSMKYNVMDNFIAKEGI